MSGGCGLVFPNVCGHKESVSDPIHRTAQTRGGQGWRTRRIGKLGGRLDRADEASGWGGQADQVDGQTKEMGIASYLGNCHKLE